MDNILDVLDGELAGRRHKVWAEINLAALVRNYKRILNKSRGATVIPVIKADAYGHGAVRSMLALREAGAEIFAVSSIDEAIELRHAPGGDNIDIIILGYTPEENADLLCKYDIIQTVFSLEYAKALDSACENMGVDGIRVHIKLNTGMNRLGFNTSDTGKAVDEIAFVSKLAHLKSVGIFTHFACADEFESTLTLEQTEHFENTVAELGKAGIDTGMRHICNSAGILRDDIKAFDAVRAGIILYGLMPSGEFDFEEFETVMTLKARVAHVHEIDVGETVSYGATFKADRRMKIATLTIGYADGFIRAYSGANVTINGKECPVIGRVCMDQCMADVSGVDVKPGDEAVLFENRRQIETLAGMASTITYETTCLIGKRVPRIYTEK